jgi:hypothetical protein
MAVHCENHTEHIHCVGKIESFFFTVKAGSKHSAQYRKPPESTRSPQPLVPTSNSLFTIISTLDTTQS